MKSVLIAVSMFAAALFGTQDEKKKVEVIVDHDVTVETSGEASHQVRVFSTGGAGLNKVLFLEQKDGNHFTFDINGETMELDEENFQVGDTKTFETDEGTITITRDDEGILITDEEGDETRILGDGHQSMFVHKMGAHMDDIIINPQSKVVISGLGDIGDEVREAVKAALEEAGIDKDIVFSGANQFIWVDEDGDEHHPDGDVIFMQKHGDEDSPKIIKKRIKKKKIH